MPRHARSALTSLLDLLQQFTADPDPMLAVARIAQLCIAIRNLTSRLYLHPDHLGEPDTPRSLATRIRMLEPLCHP